MRIIKVMVFLILVGFLYWIIPHEPPKEHPKEMIQLMEFYKRAAIENPAK